MFYTSHIFYIFYGFHLIKTNDFYVLYSLFILPSFLETQTCWKSKTMTLAILLNHQPPSMQKINSREEFGRFHLEYYVLLSTTRFVTRHCMTA